MVLQLDSGIDYRKLIIDSVGGVYLKLINYPSFVSPIIHPFILPSIHSPPISVNISHPSISFIYPSCPLFIHPSIHPFNHLSIPPFSHLSIHSPYFFRPNSAENNRKLKQLFEEFAEESETSRQPTQKREVSFIIYSFIHRHFCKEIGIFRA